MREVFHGFGILHATLAVLAAIGFFKFWARTRFWLPKYVHVLAGVGLAVGIWLVASASSDSPVKQGGPPLRLLLMFTLPTMVYFFFIFYGGQHASFRRTIRKTSQCPFCRKPLAAEPLTDESAESLRFLEPHCRHCGQDLTQFAG